MSKIKHKPLPPQAELDAKFIYHEDTGKLYWRLRKGQQAGSLVNKIGNSYRAVRVNTMLFLEHRIIWMLMTGVDPEILEIDHINNVKDDNRWENLRLATHAHNNQNTLLQKNNSSGVKGVAWHGQRQCWRAYISVGPRNASKQHSLGLFSTVEEAGRAVAAARELLHKDFSNHG